MRTFIIASAIIRRGDAICMVQQPDADGLYWFIPGGVVEPGESMLDALRREVLEETGLTLDEPGKLAYLTQVEADDRRTMAGVFDVSAFRGELRPDDPDDLTHDAAFVPVADAVRRLERAIWPSMRDPLRAYLRGEASAGAVWTYRQHDFRTFTLTGCTLSND